MENAAQRLIVALDDMREDRIFEVVKNTNTFAATYKIGLALFVAHGPSIVKTVADNGANVFLDLKLHDIPMQVEKAVKNALALRPRFLTVHAQGGKAMLQAAAQAVYGTSTKLLAVTMLTSLHQNDLDDLGINSPVRDQVLRLSELAIASGIDGIVCSPQELSFLRERLGMQAYLVCPGIRGADDPANDQARTLSAYDAITKGASALVVGRPITQADNCLLKAESIHREITKALNGHHQYLEISP